MLNVEIIDKRTGIIIAACASVKAAMEFATTWMKSHDYEGEIKIHICKGYSYRKEKLKEVSQ